MGRIRPSARAVVRRQARSLGCPVWELGKDYTWSLRRDGTLTVGLPGITVRGIRLRMDGGFQRTTRPSRSRSLALGGGGGDPAVPFSRRGGCRAVRGPLPGRLCRLPGRNNRGAWVDGGHNPDAAGTLAREIAVSPPWGKGRRLIALWSMLADKDHAGYLRALAPHFRAS